MPKRGNLRKKTSDDDGEDAGAGADDAPAIVPVVGKKSKPKKKGDGGTAPSLLRGEGALPERILGPPGLPSGSSWLSSKGGQAWLLLAFL